MKYMKFIKSKHDIPSLLSHLSVDPISMEKWIRYSNRTQWKQYTMPDYDRCTGPTFCRSQHTSAYRDVHVSTRIQGQALGFGMGRHGFPGPVGQQSASRRSLESHKKELIVTQKIHSEDGHR